MKPVFELSEITEELLKSVVFYDLFVSTGLGGPGCLQFFTDEGQSYFIGFEDLEIDEWEFLKRFPAIDACLKCFEDEQDCLGFTITGEWYHRHLSMATYIFVREDFAKRYLPAFEPHSQKICMCEWTIAEDLLDSEGRFPQMMLKETAESIHRRTEKMRLCTEHWGAVRLRSEDVVWHSYTPNNQIPSKPMGLYMLLFKENEGKTCGLKWTIEFQNEQLSERREEANARVEAYNLFCKQYENMGGRLEYPDPNEEQKMTYEFSTLDDGCCDYGQFVRSYKTLEAAQNAALERTDGYDRENLLRLSYDAMTKEEIKADYLRTVERNAKLQIDFPAICPELLRILAGYDFPGNAIPEICDKLHLTREDVLTIWNFFDPTPFCGTEQSKSAEILKTARFFRA